MVLLKERKLKAVKGLKIIERNARWQPQTRSLFDRRKAYEIALVTPSEYMQMQMLNNSARRKKDARPKYYRVFTVNELGPKWWIRYKHHKAKHIEIDIIKHEIMDKIV